MYRDLNSKSEKRTKPNSTSCHLPITWPQSQLLTSGKRSSSSTIDSLLLSLRRRSTTFTLSKVPTWRCCRCCCHFEIKWNLSLTHHRCSLSWISLQRWMDDDKTNSGSAFSFFPKKKISISESFFRMTMARLHRQISRVGSTAATSSKEKVTQRLTGLPHKTHMEKPSKK